MTYEMSIYVSISNIDEDQFSDDNYNRTQEIVKEKIREIAEILGGNIDDLEIK